MFDVLSQSTRAALLRARQRLREGTDCLEAACAATEDAEVFQQIRDIQNDIEHAMRKLWVMLTEPPHA
jgi:hypothetical protein